MCSRESNNNKLDQQGQCVALMAQEFVFRLEGEHLKKPRFLRRLSQQWKSHLVGLLERIVLNSTWM